MAAAGDEQLFPAEWDGQREAIMDPYVEDDGQMTFGPAARSMAPFRSRAAPYPQIPEEKTPEDGGPTEEAAIASKLLQAAAASAVSASTGPAAAAAVPPTAVL